ncbi:MAG TPA: plastocyanin/azurin family copper-binding protein, partial [Acidimicrobiia bacterium]|nr:plastocyanin/azurin family copper-binding protein [Acidimicrobiia bacterium]
DLQAEMGFPGLHVVQQGEVQSARAFFPEEGDYTFYCAIPGHRAAGMEGSIAVTGDPKTLDEAKAEVGDTGEAGAAGTETPTS